MGGFCFLNSVVNHRGDFHFLWTVHVYVFYFIVKTKNKGRICGVKYLFDGGLLRALIMLIVHCELQREI